MGREIRMVPPNWEHPKNEREHFQPMFDRNFSDAAAEWKRDFSEWESGVRPDYCGDENKSLEFWEWHGGPPDREYYRPWKDEEATWFQVWETVSEGTPVTPPFATREELASYLAASGDYWDQKRGDGPWGVESANAFVFGSGWAPSLIITGTGDVVESRDCAKLIDKEK